MGCDPTKPVVRAPVENEMSASGTAQPTDLADRVMRQRAHVERLESTIRRRNEEIARLNRTLESLHHAFSKGLRQLSERMLFRLDEAERLLLERKHDDARAEATPGAVPAGIEQERPAPGRNAAEHRGEQGHPDIVPARDLPAG